MHICAYLFFAKLGRIHNRAIRCFHLVVLLLGIRCPRQYEIEYNEYLYENVSTEG